MAMELVLLVIVKVNGRPLVEEAVIGTIRDFPAGMVAAMKLMETGPLVATPNRSSGIPSASTIVARTVMVPPGSVYLMALVR